ncbi:hypothetical protein [Geminocystis herdmanii]|nr:hypothetical protein [Geminocystis herdmanii]
MQSNLFQKKAISKSLQIFLARISGISLCRGIADRLFWQGLCHYE